MGMINSGLVGRGAAKVEDAQRTPTQRHISPSILVYEDIQSRTSGRARRRLSTNVGERHRHDRCALHPYCCVPHTCQTGAVLSPKRVGVALARCMFNTQVVNKCLSRVVFERLYQNDVLNCQGISMNVGGAIYVYVVSWSEFPLPLQPAPPTDHTVGIQGSQTFVSLRSRRESKRTKQKDGLFYLYPS
jgi:hypothetical protein